MRNKILGVFVIVLFAALFHTANADVVISQDFNDGDLIMEPVEFDVVDISWLPFDVEQGDVLWHSTAASLVALNHKEALRLDFNVPEWDEVPHPVCSYPRPELMCDRYEKIGKANAFISWVLDAEMDDLWKQVIIWKYLGVDEAALRIQWLEYGHTKEEYEQLSNSEYMVKARLNDIGVLFEDALESNLIGIDYYSANGYSSVTLHLFAYDYQYFDVFRTHIPVNIPIGQVFENKNQGNQNLGVAEPVEVYMVYGRNKMLELRTYCINAHKGVPSSSDGLEAGGQVDEQVLGVMIGQYAAGNTKNYRGTAQSAVWSETDGSGYTPMESHNVPDDDVMEWINTEGPLEFSGPDAGPDAGPDDTGNPGSDSNPTGSADATNIVFLVVIAIALVSIVSAAVGVMLAK